MGARDTYLFAYVNHLDVRVVPLLIRERLIRRLVVAKSLLPGRNGTRGVNTGLNLSLCTVAAAAHTYSHTENLPKKITRHNAAYRKVSARIIGVHVDVVWRLELELEVLLNDLRPKTEVGLGAR